MELEIIEGVGAVLRKVAAVAVMPRFAALLPHQTEMKAANEPVTIADRESEIMIGRELLALLPHSRVIGEEACSENPALLKSVSDGMVWIVDPIDGTANFAAGRAPFAMMVALLRDGKTVGAWILDPLGDRLAIAELGGGAWIDGKRLRPGGLPATLGELSGIVSEAFLPAANKGIVDRLRATVGSIVPTARCAGHEYPLVAVGARHFALYWRTLVWDHAPGALLLTEAGGTVTHLDGRPYDPSRSQTGLLLAHDPSISKHLLEVTAQRA